MTTIRVLIRKKLLATIFMRSSGIRFPVLVSITIPLSSYRTEESNFRHVDPLKLYIGICIFMATCFSMKCCSAHSSGFSCPDKQWSLCLLTEWLRDMYSESQILWHCQGSQRCSPKIDLSSFPWEESYFCTTESQSKVRHAQERTRHSTKLEPNHFVQIHKELAKIHFCLRVLYSDNACPIELFEHRQDQHW